MGLWGKNDIADGDDESAEGRTERKAAEKQARQRDREKARQRRKEEREAREFAESPAGQAREVYQRGDRIFQVSFNLQDVGARIAVMENALTTRKAHDVSDVLNSILAEGWELHSFSTTFVNEGEESRDKFMASGQQVAVRGHLVGTYVFTRT